ncbi:MAG: RnfABCDGE type electron transport complex subunit D, partial [Clostridia bacterium]|nr:RnfABCDGE type electron transport complex subunit D [Clostridia bacterium]
MATENNSSNRKSLSIFGDYLLMLVFPCVLSVWYYGVDAVRTLVVCIVTGFICDFFGSIIIYKKFYAADLSSFCTSIMIALMMPADIAFYIPVIACTFSVLVIKIPFGGGMKAPFVPAAAGFAFMAACFKDEIFAYTPVRPFMSGVSLGSTLMHGGSMRLNSANVLDMITGNICGPMGTGCIIVFAACIVFLLFRRKEALLATAGFLGACILFALLLPRSNGSRISSVIMELSSGSLMFAA